ncbi:alpha/beta fold hydrolase [Sphingomonas canadensis]|uniref:Alpha/beta fold hydrolase n=1 Tax=Sphingomonas canadensis TaxID=1219257 RepID=A0ABW3HAU9_9SPHN|nr:alpha/beta hydrolase [Sphingomonas canadensis]MCW3838320.1 alpha/beta hydrolase [Sphingomonas canadensis]
MDQARQHLVLVPGSLCDARVWHHQAKALSDVAEPWIPHLHGHDSLVAMAHAVLAEAPERFALCGFSMGGRVALEMLRLAPERITRLALIDASVHPVAEGEAARRQPQIDMARDQGMAALARWWNPRIAHPSMHGDADYMGLLESMACSFTPQEYAREVRALLERPDPRGLLGGIAVPVLVLSGEEDPLSTPDRNRAMADAIPGARLILIGGAAHFPMLEKAEAVTAALRDWLAA